METSRNSKPWHKNVPPIPTDLYERKALMWWLQEHPLWKTPAPQILLDTEMELSTEEKEELLAGDNYDVCVRVIRKYVNPATEEIDDDENKNTAFRVWINAGPMVDRAEYEGQTEPEEGWNDLNRWIPSRDYRLNCGSPYLETALLGLALRVKFFYGDDGTDNELHPCEGSWTHCEAHTLSDEDVTTLRADFNIQKAEALKAENPDECQQGLIDAEGPDMSIETFCPACGFRVAGQ